MTMLSPGEKRLLNELPKHTTVKEAANAIGMKPQYAGYLLYTTRRKLAVMEATLKIVHQQMRRDKLTNKVLTPKS